MECWNRKTTRADLSEFQFSLLPSEYKAFTGTHFETDCQSNVHINQEKKAIHWIKQIEFSAPSKSALMEHWTTWEVGCKFQLKTRLRQIQLFKSSHPGASQQIRILWKSLFFSVTSFKRWSFYLFYIHYTQSDTFQAFFCLNVDDYDLKLMKLLLHGTSPLLPLTKYILQKCQHSERYTHYINALNTWMGLFLHKTLHECSVAWRQSCWDVMKAQAALTALLNNFPWYI